MSLENEALGRELYVMFEVNRTGSPREVFEPNWVCMGAITQEQWINTATQFKDYLGATEPVPPTPVKRRG